MKKINYNKKDFVILLAIFLGIWTLIHFGGPKIPPLSSDGIEKGFYTKKNILKKLRLDFQPEQPLVRLLSRPEDFYEKRIITNGYFKMTTPDYGILYMNKEDAIINNYYNGVGLGMYLSFDPRLEKVSLKEFDNRYITVSGTFSNLAGQLIIYNIDSVWDLQEMSDLLFGGTPEE